MNNARHYAAGLLAFFIWGFFPIPLRVLQGTPVGVILYYRILFSFVAVLLAIFLFRRKSLVDTRSFYFSLTIRQRTQVVALTLVGAVFLAINWLTFIYTVNSVNIKTASFSYLICPVLTAVLGYLLLKERLTILQWIAVGICAISCVLIGIVSVSELGYSFLTALSYALYLITQRKNQGADRLVVLVIQTLFVLLVLSAVFNYLVPETPGDLKFFMVIAVIAIVFTALPMFLSLYALQQVNSASIGILMYLNPMINFVLAFTLFDETVYPIQVAGYGFIFIALVLFNYPILTRIRLIPE